MSRRSAPTEILLVKWGGGLLTDKTRPRSLKSRTLHRLARELAAGLGSSRVQVILGHGSGSYGHVAAARARLDGARFRPADPRAARSVQREAAALHRRVLEALEQAGLAPFSAPPSAWMAAPRGRLRIMTEALEEALAAGMLPVVYGDLILGEGGRARIASTEEVLVSLARKLRRRGVRIRRALWAGATSGVLGPDGSPIPRITSQDARLARRWAGGSGGTDVTGGMAHRLEATLALARLGVESLVFDGGRRGALATAVRGGKVPGTRVVPASRGSSSSVVD